MAETTNAGPKAGVRLIELAPAVIAPSAAHTAEVLAELPATTPTGRQTA
ncbi:hypothetical protein Mycsm_04373 [Mycobacterium sp. JS623]|nr:hypothetical protein [Mycobacterium sp. JS623]AGB24617.1 hypothetical protein Mycsm_04373 [Mycobacterium sp. JS623]